MAITLIERLKKIHTYLGEYELFIGQRRRNLNCDEAINARAVQEDIEDIIGELKIKKDE